MEHIIFFCGYNINFHNDLIILHVGTNDLEVNKVLCSLCSTYNFHFIDNKNVKIESHL